MSMQINRTQILHIPTPHTPQLFPHDRLQPRPKQFRTTFQKRIQKRDMPLLHHPLIPMGQFNHQQKSNTIKTMK